VRMVGDGTRPHHPCAVMKFENSKNSSDRNLTEFVAIKGALIRTV